MLIKALKIFIPAFLLLYSFSGNSQIIQPVEWEFEKERIGENDLLLIIKADIETNWYLYGLDIPTGGPIPTSFHFDESDHYELVGDLEEMTEPEIKHDPFFDMELPLFHVGAWFRQRVRILTDQEFSITGFVEFMSCDDERCLPPQERHFEFIINDDSPPAVNGDKDIETEISDEKGEVAKIDPPSDVLPGSDIDKGSSPTTLDETFEYESEFAQGTEEGRSLWIFFFIAFAGGLAGLLTPCVFPIIPMTVSFFMQKQSGRLNGILNAMVFGISIIAVYTGLGLLVSLTSVGAGFANQLTSHWLPNLIFFLLFIFFAASFFGMFEITLPGSLATKSDRKADKGGFTGTFFMALTLVIVSLSCVGPIVGALLVEAATGTGSQPVIGMFGFSFAFALPFTLLAIFPSWLGKLPKSGGWLNSVKVVLGFIILAFSLRFLTIVDQAYHWGILTRDVFLAIWIVIFIMLGFYLLGKIRFSHDSESHSVSFPRLVLAILSFSFAIWMIPGMFGAPLKPIASLLPSQHTQSFDMAAMIRNTGFTGSGTAGSDLCDEPEYNDFLHLPHGLEGYFDLEQGLACAEEQNKPVFFDFVGHACANCREMEAKVWSDPRVLQRLRDDYIIIALYVDDRTRLPEEKQIVSLVDGRTKNTIGSRNLDFQISQFNTNTQPYYVLADHELNLLNHPRGYNLDIEAFIEFLDRGVENFHRKQAIAQD